MTVDDSMMPLSESVKVPQVYKIDTKEASYDKEKNAVKVNETRVLIGLTKEQLQQYRNDPFWKIFRYVMFILFWFVWLAMFGGAVVLVVVSPKCVFSKGEALWWQKQNSYQIFTPSFRDSDGDGIGDFKGILEKLGELRKTGVDTIWVRPVIATQKDDFLPLDVIDFTNVDERFGTKEDLKALIDEAHKQDMHFTMDLPVSTTSVSHEWFKRSLAGEGYRDYYIWKKAFEVQDDTDYVIVPNKELAYLAYEGKDPVLNWENEQVRDAVFKVAKDFVDLGVDGFHVAYISQIMKQQPISQAQTALAIIGDFAWRLNEYVRSNESLKNEDIVLYSSLDDIDELRVIDSAIYKQSNLTYVIDNSVTKLDTESCTAGISKCLYSILVASLQYFEQTELPRVWQFTNSEVPRLPSRFDPETADLITLVQLALPGAIQIYYGQELNLPDASSTTGRHTGLMQWDTSDYAGFSSTKEKPFFTNTNESELNNFMVQMDAPHSSLKMFKIAAKLRQRDNNLITGETRLAPLNNDLILFSRFHRVNNITTGEVYVLVANFADNENQIVIDSMFPTDYPSSKAEVVTATPNSDDYPARKKLENDKAYYLGAKQGILLKALKS